MTSHGILNYLPSGIRVIFDDQDDNRQWDAMISPLRFGETAFDGLFRVTDQEVGVHRVVAGVRLRLSHSAV